MRRALLLILVGILGYLPIQAQEIVDSVRIHYRAAEKSVDPDYHSNGQELDRFTTAVRRAADDGTLDHIVIRSGASPDGTQQTNERLARYRVDSLAAYLVRTTGVADSLLEKQALGILWDGLHAQVSASDMPWRDEVLHILETQPEWSYDARGRITGSRKQSLMNLHGGVPYQYMLKHLFPDLRTSTLTLFCIRREVAEEPPVADVTPADSLAEVPAPVAGSAGSDTPPQNPIVAEEPAADAPVSAPQPVVTPQTEEWHPAIRVKTNAVGWAMMMANAAVEIDLSRRLSVNLPIYYSACNYFTPTIKFRMLGTQPELRIWPLRERRFFIGAHFGVFSYNLALGGDWRIQDHDGRNPALGGGLNVGYRIPLGRHARWNVEFSLGAGAYKAYYDKFHNESQGSRASTVRKTFVGLDNAAVSFSYLFDLKKTRK